MAAAIKALNARIRANPVADYFCSTHFWGPASNFGIPIAAVLDTQKDPEIISGRFTGVLVVYSAVFMRYAMSVSPRNYLLFTCHAVNCGAQATQMYRWTNYWYLGGREKALFGKVAEGVNSAAQRVEVGVENAKGAAKDHAIKAEGVAKEITEQAKSKLENVTK